LIERYTVEICECHCLSRAVAAGNTSATRYAKSCPRWTVLGAKNSLARGRPVFGRLNHSNRFYQPILKTRSGAGKPAPQVTAKNPAVWSNGAYKQ